MIIICQLWMVMAGHRKWKTQPWQFFLSDEDKKLALKDFDQGPLSNGQGTDSDTLKSPQCMKSNPMEVSVP